MTQVARAVRSQRHSAKVARHDDYLWDPFGVKLINHFLDLETLEKESREFQDLIREVAADRANCKIEHFIKVQSSASMNYAFYEYHREEDIPASCFRMEFRLSRLRLALLKKLGWRAWIRFEQQRALMKNVFRGLLLMPLRHSNYGKVGCCPSSSVPAN